VNEAPTAIALSNTTALNNRKAGATIGKLTGLDADADSHLQFTLVDGAVDNGQFRIDGNVLKTATGAAGLAIQTRIGVDGMSGTLRTPAGEKATLESELVFTGETTFQQTGMIAFGSGDHQLRFSSVGSGYLGPATAADCRHGAAIWRVDGGDGQFAGASGLIVSNFFVSTTGEVTDHQLGVVFTE
jgi:hypothetical protein